MFREEYFFIDKPSDDLTVTQYKTGTVVYDETKKEWTFTTTDTSSEASCALNIGNFTIGDRIVFECEAEAVSGDNSIVQLISVSSTGTKAYYTGKGQTGNERGNNKRIVFEVVDDLTFEIKFGMIAKLGETKIKNVQIKKITQAPQGASGVVDKLKAAITKTASGWSLVTGRGSNECTITENDTLQLQVQFTQSLKNVANAFTQVEYTTTNSPLITKTAFPSNNRVSLKFQKEDGNFDLLANLPVGIVINVLLV